jgi:hypothetical protein
MYKKLLAFFTVIALSIAACSTFTVNVNSVKGSGNVTSETRNLSGFTGIDLQGSADVDVAIGEPESVVVEAEDNILPLIETKVQNGQLIISTKPLTNLSTTKPVRVHIKMKTLDSVSISGSGNITAPGLNAGEVNVDLPGSGNINLSGTANKVVIKLGGSGNVFCDQLKSSSAKVDVSGSGNVKVYASESLDATISGSGNIQYSGNPSQVNKNVTGSGSIVSQ